MSELEWFKLLVWLAFMGISWRTDRHANRIKELERKVDRLEGP